MSRYCYAPVDTVIEGPKFLPESWTDPVTQKKYTNLPSLSDPELNAIGWKIYIENDPGAPGEYYDRILSNFIVSPTDVTRNVTYNQWDIDRVKQLKNSELETSLPQYTTNEQAINPKVNEYINDDAKWFADEQAKLARLTDWQAVADFDTTKPMVLSLPNSYVGAKYVSQGTTLTAQNTAAVDSGLSLIWDQTEVDSFIASNQLAAEDSSNATAPVKPGYKIRQPIANVSEQFNRVIIYRFDRDDPIPSQQRAYAMQISNRQDNRNLYIFSFTGTTYLTWRLFEDQGNGIWYLEATAAERQYTDTDMAFIFSYGTNPAVETDYFTDRIEFPAGVEETNLLVAWDPV